MPIRRLFSIFLIAIVIFSILPLANAEEIELKYDANGNLIQDANFYYEYNSLNQLKQIREKSAQGRIIAKYTYDHNGKRILKELFDAQGKSKTVYYPDENFVREVDERTKAVNDIVYYYDSDLVAKKENNKLSFYHPDHIGSTSVVTDEQGKVIENNHYLPFGEMLQGKDDRYLYTSQEYDPESQLYYYGARYYSPYLAKFTQPDTIIQDPYNPQNLNRYSYALNNPYKYNDPSGNTPLLVLAGVAVLGGAALGAIFDAGKQILFDDRNLDTLDWNEVGKGALAGAAGGAGAFLGGVSGGAIVASLGVGSGITNVIVGATEGLSAGGSYQITDNLLENKPFYEDVAITSGTGVILGGVGGKVLSPKNIKSSIPKNEFPLQRGLRTYLDSQNTGYTFSPHSTARLAGHLNSGRIQSKESVIDVIKYGKSYYDPKPGNAPYVKYYNGIKIAYDENNNIRSIIPGKLPRRMISK